MQFLHDAGWWQNAYRKLILTVCLGFSFHLLAPAAFSMAQVVSTAPKAGSASMDRSHPYQLPPDKQAKAEALGNIRTALHFGSELWELALITLFLASGIASRIGRRISETVSKGWLQALLYSALLVILLYCVAELPPAAISHAYSIRYGISVQSWGSWLLDEAKTLALTVSLAAPTLTLIYGLMRWRWSRTRYWFWLWVGAVPVILLTAFVEPQVIEPMFDNFTPLAQTHPALVQQLERVVARTGTSIPPERMFLMQASAKSNGLNAYVSGLGATKRVVVWDTTADRMPTDQILFIFGHESGHYVLNHIPKGLTLACLGLLVSFWLTSRLADWLIRRYGRSWRIDLIASLPGLVVLLLAFAIFQTVSEPLQNAVSRHFEHEADVYGQEAMHGILPDPQKTAVDAFNTLGTAYLDNPDPSPFVEFWTYGHPSIQSRAKFAAQYDPWPPGQTPKFFPR